MNVLNESLVYILNEMLTYTYDSKFIDYNYPTMISLLPKITKKYAIKSGTTNSDMWIIGYNKDAVLGVWTGYDDNRNLSSENSSIHKDIWIETMEGFLDDKKNSWYDVPENIVGVLVNPITGEIATEENKNSKLFYFIKGTEPHADYNYDLDSVFQEDNSTYNEEKDLENSSNESTDVVGNENNTDENDNLSTNAVDNNNME